MTYLCFGIRNTVNLSSSNFSKIIETLFHIEDFESSKFLSLIGEDTNWFFPIGYSKSSIVKRICEKLS